MPNANMAVGSANVVHGAKSAPKTSGVDLEAKAIGALQLGGMLTPFVFLGSMISKPVAWILGGAVGLVHKNSGLAVKGAINGFYTALHTTKAGEIGRFGLNYAEARSEITGKAVANYGERAARGAARSEVINSAVSKVASPVGSVLGKGLDRLDETSVMQKISGWVKNFAGKRETKILLNVTDEAGIAKAGFWRNISQSKGVGALLKALPKNVGKAPLFSLLGFLGVTFGTSAMVLSNNRSTREDKGALAEFAAAVYGVDESAVTKQMLSGDQAHPLVKEAAKIYDKNVVARRIMNIFSITGDVAFGVNMTSAASGTLMAAEFLLPQIGTMLAHENPMLSVFHALKESDKGSMQLDSQQRAQAIAYLVSTVPAVAKHGGMHNAYVMPVAEAIAKKGLSAVEIVQTIADPAKFDAISKQAIAEVNQQNEVAKQASVTPAVTIDKNKPAANDALYSHKIDHTRPAANDASKVPVAKVSGISHEGQLQVQAGLKK